MTRRPTVSETVDQLIASARIKEAALLKLLEVIEARLGTNEEQPNDLHAVTEIAHRLITLSCVALLPIPEPAKEAA